MNVLLDTHLFIWWLKDDRKLSKKARIVIEEANEVYVSSASIWEAAIKVQMGKLDVDIDLLLNSIESEGFCELPISAKHAANVAKLPSYHRDPFDRILISQAMLEPLRLLTVDKQLKKYSELVNIL